MLTSRLIHVFGKTFFCVFFFVVTKPETGDFLEHFTILDYNTFSTVVNWRGLYNSHYLRGKSIDPVVCFLVIISKFDHDVVIGECHKFRSLFVQLQDFCNRIFKNVFGVWRIVLGQVRIFMYSGISYP